MDIVVVISVIIAALAAVASLLGCWGGAQVGEGN